MAVISKGIKLSYKVSEGQFTELTNLFEIPELGGDVDKIEVTTLASEAHEYTNGIKNYGDTVAFKFYYEKNQFTTLSVNGKLSFLTVLHTPSLVFLQLSLTVLATTLHLLTH